MKYPMNAIVQVVENLLRTDAHKATKFFGEKDIVRASRRTYKGKISKGNVEIVLTLGKPNYAEREFIKTCKKAGEKFPLKKVQLKFAPKKRTAKK